MDGSSRQCLSFLVLECKLDDTKSSPPMVQYLMVIRLIFVLQPPRTGTRTPKVVEYFRSKLMSIQIYQAFKTEMPSNTSSMIYDDGILICIVINNSLSSVVFEREAIKFEICRSPYTHIFFPPFFKKGNSPVGNSWWGCFKGCLHYIFGWLDSDTHYNDPSHVFCYNSNEGKGKLQFCLMQAASLITSSQILHWV